MRLQEDIDEQLTAKKRQAEIRRKQEEMDKLRQELEITKHEEKKARALRISETDMERARAGSILTSTNF